MERVEYQLHTTGGLAQCRQLSRRQYCGNFHVITPQQVQWKPPLRQAAGTLAVSLRTAQRKTEKPKAEKWRYK